jgi:hypothetical protein
MRLIKEDDDYKLANLTGLTTFNVRRCKILLKFSRKYLDMTLVEDSTKKVTGDFFVELYPSLQLIKKNLPDLSRKFDDEYIIDVMLKKYREEKITAITDFRKLADTLRLIRKGIAHEKIGSAVEAIISNPEIGIRETYDRTAQDFYSMQHIIRASNSFQKYLKETDLKNLEKPSELISTLKKLRDSINNILMTLGEV